MRQTSKKIVMLISLVFFSLIFYSIYNNNIGNSEEAELKQDEFINDSDSWDLTGTPILIDDNNPSYNWAITASTQPWCSGSGTWSDPYTIENVTIDGQNIISTLIQIEHSSVYFIIKNCILYGSVSAGNALYLAVVDNGIIMNNSIYDVGDGIDLINSNNNTICNNKIYNNNKNGIIINSWVYGGDKNRIIENEIYNNNEYGIYFDGDPSYIMKDNIISNNNISFNGIDGIRLFYSDYNIINSNNIFNNTEDGIQLHVSSYYNKIIGNNFTGNIEYGIENYGYNTEISFNTFLNNLYGIYNHGDDTIIRKNNFTDNDLYGLVVSGGSDNNIIFNNQFINNSVNAYDYSSSTEWDNGSLGNYWNDYSGLDGDDNGIGDSSYDVPPTGGSVDNYPIFEDEYISPGPFILNSTAPDINGNFKVNWSNSIGADNYSIYWLITKGNMLSATLVESGLTNNSYFIFNFPDGTFFFVIVAYNETGFTFSNNEEIIVSYAINGDANGGGGGGKSSDDYTIPFGNDYLLIVLISIITLTVLKKRKISFKKGLD